MKIVIRQTADSIIANIDDRKFLSLKNVHNLKVTHPQLDEYYVLGILNSKLVSWWYQQLVPECGRVFAEVKVVNLQKIPLCTTCGDTRNFGNLSSIIASKVGQILALKCVENADTKTLEAEIDQQVYALYGLSPEEIAIVEGTGK